MRRRTLLVALAGLAVVVTAGIVVLRHPDPPRPVTSISKTTFTRVKVGMTTGEVAAILGPPGDNRTMETEPDNDAIDSDYDLFGSPDVIIAQTFAWQTDKARVYVRFDGSRKACSGIYCPTRRSTENTLHRLLKRANELWHRWFP
jgi:hypothetical protein